MKNNLEQKIKDDEEYFDRLKMLRWNLSMIKFLFVLHILFVILTIRTGEFKAITIAPVASFIMAFFITKMSIIKVENEDKGK